MVLIFFLLPMMCLTFAFEGSDCVGVVSFVRISFAYGATTPMPSYFLVLHVVATLYTRFSLHRVLVILEGPKPTPHKHAHGKTTQNIAVDNQRQPSRVNNTSLLLYLTDSVVTVRYATERRQVLDTLAYPGISETVGL